MTPTSDERAAMLARYRAGSAAVLAALDGITDEELDAHPNEGEWSVREIVHHLADGEMSSALRLRRLVVEDRPAITGYDEGLYARTLFYGDRPIGPSLEAMAGARASTADILERLDEATWLRAGTHSEMGEYPMETWLRIYTAHPYDHADQIRRVLAAVRGRPG